MKNILVLTDFSDRARSAAEYAVQVAAHVKANVLLCHALELTEQLTYPLADHLILKNQAMKRLKEVGIHLNELISKNGDPDLFRPTITYFNDLDMLTDVADKVILNYKIDLVVIGSHKTSSMARFFSGSHTNDILDDLKCPILLVPENVTYRPVQNIAYATDLTFNNSKVIGYLAKIASLFGAKIFIDHISPLDLPLTILEKEVEYSVKEQMDKINVDLTYRTIKGVNITKGLLEISDPEKVDILTLVHKRYDFFEGLFHSSVSKQLAHTTKVPLLVMPYSFSLSEGDLMASV
ncbi:MAG: universal stress protein [Pyrinomonadaceae bacterium]|nr:universal stress protein [Sphingobacteriaceae bacterium]